MNIRGLNQNYSQYADIFPELRELSVVARLMGLCIWMQKANLNQIDLDELLTVDLPVVQTPREKKQLIAVTLISMEEHSDLQTSDVAARATVRYLTPMLDETVNAVFPKDETLADFLAQSAGVDNGQNAAYQAEAKDFRFQHGNELVSQAIMNHQGLRAFASAAADTIDIPDAPELTALHDTIITKQAEIARLKERLQAVETSMDSGGVDVYNSYINTYNGLVRQMRAAQKEVNDIIDNYNSRSAFSHYICEISGGIGLEPENFKLSIKKSSPELEQTKRIAQMEDSTTVIQGEQWGRSAPAKSTLAKKTLRLNRSWVAGEKKQTQTATMSSVTSGNSESYWRSITSPAGTWQDQTVQPNTATERYYDASTRKLQVADFQDGNLKACEVGKYDGRDTIVFEKSPRQAISSPQQPPNWWK